MVDQGQARQNGRTGGDEALKDAVEGSGEPASVELPEERARKFRSPGLARMRTDWKGDDGIMMARVHTVVEKRIAEHFMDAFSILFEFYEIVREPMTENGEPMFDHLGFPMWRKGPSGMYVEDWDRLNGKQRERFLFQITTRVFEWSQRAASAWGEAMFAKAIWEEAFSSGYESLPGSKPTIDDRTARAKLDSAEDRYFALFLSYYSRKADSLVKNMELLAQRLKDVHVSNGSR